MLLCCTSTKNTKGNKNLEPVQSCEYLFIERNQHHKNKDSGQSRKNFDLMKKTSMKRNSEEKNDCPLKSMHLRFQRKACKSLSYGNLPSIKVLETTPPSTQCVDDYFSSLFNIIQIKSDEQGLLKKKFEIDSPGSSRRNITEFGGSFSSLYAELQRESDQNRPTLYQPKNCDDYTEYSKISNKDATDAIPNRPCLPKYHEHQENDNENSSRIPSLVEALGMSRFHLSNLGDSFSSLCDNLQAERLEKSNRSIEGPVTRKLIDYTKQGGVISRTPDFEMAQDRWMKGESTNILSNTSQTSTGEEDRYPLSSNGKLIQNGQQQVQLDEQDEESLVEFYLKIPRKTDRIQRQQESLNSLRDQFTKRKKRQDVPPSIFKRVIETIDREEK